MVVMVRGYDKTQKYEKKNKYKTGKYTTLSRSQDIHGSQIITLPNE